MCMSVSFQQGCAPQILFWLVFSQNFTTVDCPLYSILFFLYCFNNHHDVILVCVSDSVQGYTSSIIQFRGLDIDINTSLQLTKPLFSINDADQQSRPSGGLKLHSECMSYRYVDVTTRKISSNFVIHILTLRLQCFKLVITF